MAASGATTDSSPRVSLWAVASMLCGVGILPPFCVLAILLGVIGLVQTRPGRRYSGRRFAVVGVTLGVVGVVVTVAAAAWWSANARRPMLLGPYDAVERGMAGDIDGFQAAFVAGADVPRTEAQAFIDALQQRYGRVVDARIDGDTLGQRDPVDRLRPRLPYLFTFEGETIGAEAVFVLFDGTSPKPVLAFQEFVILDPRRGDLAYPQQP